MSQEGYRRLPLEHCRDIAWKRESCPSLHPSIRYIGEHATSVVPASEEDCITSRNGLAIFVKVKEKIGASFTVDRIANSKKRVSLAMAYSRMQLPAYYHQRWWT